MCFLEFKSQPSKEKGRKEKISVRTEKDDWKRLNRAKVMREVGRKKIEYIDCSTVPTLGSQAIPILGSKTAFYIFCKNRSGGQQTVP